MTEENRKFDPFKYLSEKNLLVPIGLIVLMVITLYIRVIPILNLNGNDIMNIVGSDDPMYNLRQVELIIQNFPKYGWFEAMTLFPTGQVVNWGPMFPTIISAICLIAGASTRPEIIGVALWVPPIMAAVMVPVTYWLVSTITDRVCGYSSAILIAVVGGQYFFRSLAGYLDHHIAEALFSTLFLVSYVIALKYIRSHEFDLKRRETLYLPLLLAAGIAATYLIGLFTMPTMILFALIVTIYTIGQFIWDFSHGRSSAALFFVNVCAFLMIAAGYFVVGNQFTQMTLAHYSMAHPISYLLLAGLTTFLYALEVILKGKPMLYYFGGVMALWLVVAVILFVVMPGMSATFISGIQEFFGGLTYYTTIQEARVWTVKDAWGTFNLGIIMMVIGLAIAIYRFIKNQRNEFLFLIIWALFITYAVCQHIRYEYYFAIVVAVMGGIGAGYFLNMAIPELILLKKKQPAQKAKELGKSAKKQPGKKQKKGYTPRADIGILAVAIPIIALFCIFSGTALYVDHLVAGIHPQMNQDWRGTLEWLGENTPDTGVDYYTVYDRNTFQYPETAYGVMSWWDYGHMITYISKRIPNANPFQAGVAGDKGAAAFFITKDEDTANRIADDLGVRYVITDIEMATGKFWAMATWYDVAVGASPYQKMFLIPDNPTTPSTFNPVMVYTDEYFKTMVSRLHNSDGSAEVPSIVYYVEYAPMPDIGPYPVIARINETTPEDARNLLEEFKRNPRPGFAADVVTPLITLPPVPVPGLYHYRLIYESPSNTVPNSGDDIKYVKVFEYVKGARVRGDGLLQVKITSNTGRDFVYNQISRNGEFTLPYSTDGNPYDVKITGGYVINGIPIKNPVPEDAVQSGKLIGG